MGNKKLVSWYAGDREDQRNLRNASGRAGKKLRTAMSRTGLKVWRGYDEPLAEQEEEVEFNGLDKCVLGVHRVRNRGASSERASESRSPHICFGEKAVEALTGLKFPMLKVRGGLLPTHTSQAENNLHPRRGVLGGQALKRDSRSLPPWILCTIAPATILRDQRNPDAKAMDYLFPFLCSDIVKAIEAPTPRVPKVQAYCDPLEVLRAWEEFFKTRERPWLSVDIEGRGGKPNIVGVAWDPGEVWVMQWGPKVQLLLEVMFKTALPVFHNGAYDIPELREAGVTPPKVWMDTMVSAATLFQQRGMMGLQSQVLTYVKGSITWKGLIDHDKGPGYGGGKAGYYRKLWTEVLTRLGRAVPSSGADWYAFYNGLDTAWTLALAFAHRDRLKGQGRWEYYTGFMQPNQAPLVWMGLQGLPVDVKRVERFKVALRRLERMAAGILRPVAVGLLDARVQEQQKEVDKLEAEREAERAAGARAFSKAKELTSVRTKLRTREKNRAAGFNPDSALQRVALLYQYLGLPEVRNRKTKSATSDEKAVENLLGRMQRGTIKAKNKTNDEAFRILRALKASKKWATWRRTFLERSVK